MTPIKVSYTRVSLYAGCPQAHYFQYVRRLRKIVVPRPLSFGSDFHRLVAAIRSQAMLSTLKAEISQKYYEASAVQQAALGADYLDNLFTVFDDYQRMYPQTDDHAVEHEVYFEHLMGKAKGVPVYFIGYIDEVLPKRTLGERKTFSQAPAHQSLVMNMQSCLYSKAYETMFGHKPRQIRWDHIKSSQASMPALLKSGVLSTAQSQSITPYSYRRACKLHGLPFDKTVAEGYRPNLSNFFFRTTIDVQPRMVDRVYADFKSLVKEIVVGPGQCDQRKSLTANCNWCNYKDLCMAEFTPGADIAHIIKKDFTEGV